MKGLKIFSILIIAVLLLAPATAQARGSRFSFSFNFFDPFFPCFVAPPPPVAVPIYVPCPPPQPVCVERRTIIKEYRCSCCCPDRYVEVVKPRCHCGCCY